VQATRKRLEFNKQSTHLIEKIILVCPTEIKGNLIIWFDCHGRSAKNGKQEGKESRNHLDVLKECIQLKSEYETKRQLKSEQERWGPLGLCDSLDDMVTPIVC
jgi:hypothetical protein